MSIAAKTDFVGANTYDDVEKVVAMSDGVVDFSTTEGAMEVARACVKYRKPLMLGTTGFTEEQMEWLRLVKDHIAVSLSIEPEDLELNPFDRKGGLGRFYEVFGEGYQKILDEMNIELVA